MKRTSFTLIELLVVIAIIAILSSLLLPSLSRSRDYARSIQCLNSLKMLAMGSQSYADSYNGWALPLCYNYSGGSYSEAWYTQNKTLYPAYAQILGMPENILTYNGFTAAYICPKASYALSHPAQKNPLCFPISRSYGMNQTILGISGGWGSSNFMGLRLSQIKNPSSKSMFNDSTDWMLTKTASLYSNYLSSGEEKNGGLNNVTAYRHNASVNIGFYDGHAGSLHYKNYQQNSLYWDNN